MANSPIVASLPAYVEQNRDLLVASAVLGSKSAKMLTLQSGIKSSAALNILTTDVTFGNGAECGWNEAGSQTLTQRILETGQIKVNMAYCDKKLLGKWAEHEVRVAAGQRVMPFEEQFTTEVINAIQAALEKAIWMGDKSSNNANLNKFDGLKKIITNAADTKKVSLESSDSYVDILYKVVRAMPSEILSKDDVVVFCDPAFAVNYVLEQQSYANIYSGREVGKISDDIRILGTNVRLVSVEGLAGEDKKVYAGRLSNFFFGCDLADDSEIFKLWYSDDNDEFRLRVDFNAGVQVAFPNQIVATTTAD